MKNLSWLAIFLLVTACATRQGGSGGPNAPAPTVSDGGDLQDPTPENPNSPEEEAEEVQTPSAPIPSSSYTALGKAMRTRSEESVIQEASKILAKNSKDLKAINAVAVMYIVNRKLEMAKILLARGIKSYPNDPTLACNLGIVQMLDDKIPEAIAEFQRAVNIDQSHAEASYHLGALHMRYKNFSAAAPLLRTAYSKLPKNLVGPHYAEALRMSRNSQEAMRVYEDLRAESSRDPALVLGFASLLLEDIKDKKRGLKMVDRIRLLTEDSAILKRADDLAQK
jgi:tetratricopeptide (TPR) repeat protein